MSYIKINGEEKHYNEDIMKFTSQHGKDGIRFIGDEIPETNKGFMYYDDNDNLLADLSDYIYFYQQNEYTTEVDTISQAEPNNTPNYSTNTVEKQIDIINQKIDNITPYIETKTAYIDETEIIFENEKQGNVLIDAVDKFGDSVDTLYKREGNNIIVSFLKPLEQITKVTLSIQ